MGKGWVGLLLVGTLAQARGLGPAVDGPDGRWGSHPLGSQRELEALRSQIFELRSEVQGLRQELSYSEDLKEAERTGVLKAAQGARGLTPAQRGRVAAAIVREARRNQLDPLLVVALIRAESSFDNFAVSPVGARGLMQVMPVTGRYLAERRGIPFGGSSHLFDYELNVELGTGYLAELIGRFGRVDHALVAYNAGPGAAKRILAGREARQRFLAGYPRKVVQEFERLKAAQGALAVRTPPVR